LENISIVHQMKTNIISQNGNINIGSSIQNSHTSNLKAVGATFSFGDDSCINEAQQQTNVIEQTKEKSDQGEKGI
jgi:hypothetical protein